MTRFTAHIHLAAFFFGLLTLGISQTVAQSVTSSQSTAVPQTLGQTLGVKTNEVLLDVLVHDKKGRIIRDLKPEEIEVFEDGVKQPVNSFRFIEGDNKKPIDESGNSITPQLNLVTLIFDHQDAQRFQTARQAAITFLDTAIKPDTLVRVFVIGRKLYLMEQFTNDRGKIAKAIERGLGTSEKAFAEVSERNVKELTALVEQAPNTVPADTKANPAQLLPRLTLNTIQQADKLLSEVGAPSPVFHLLSIARNHRQIAGRKMVFYISNGLYLPNTGLSEILRNVVSTANQANLTFYAINTRQSLANTGGVNSRLESSTVINATQRPETGTVGARDPFDSFQGRNAGGTSAFDSRSAFTAFEANGRKQELNKQSPLAQLTESTGGEVIQNINDISTVVKQGITELGIYYALSYTPSKQELDGKFRQITVKLSRSGIKPVTRSGYFAVPASAVNKPVLTYETPLLAALNNTIVPHDFNYRDSTLHFERRPNERHEVLMIEAPLAQLLPQQEDKTKKAYPLNFAPLNFAMLAIVKNAKDEIVQKFSEVYQLEIPVAQFDDARKASVYLVRHYWLPAGNYVLETVIHDQSNNRLSAHRRPFTVVVDGKGVQTSSLYLVKQIEPISDETTETENPLLTGKYKITPEIAETLSTKDRTEIPFHLSVYADPTQPAPPTLNIELLHEGKVIAKTTPQLPQADNKGLITFDAGVPTKGLLSGHYQIHSIVRQGEKTCEETLDFNVPGETKKLEEDDGIKAINSTLVAPTDRIHELALVALNAAKPIELSANKLIEEVKKSGLVMHQRLGEYTYSLRKVRRTFDKKGRLRAEEYKDYEAYPVKGQHALVQISANGMRQTTDRIALDRKQATEALIKNEEEKQKAAAMSNAAQPLGYWGAGIEGFVQGKYVYLSINPTHFFHASEFTTPRAVLLDGRETIVMDFRPRTDVVLTAEKELVQKMEGSIWIDVAEKTLVRLEGQIKTNTTNTLAAASPSNPHLVYQQQRLGANLWAPMLIRVNSGGDANLLRGLNNDVWFEFNHFKRFDSQDSDVKIQSPPPKQANP